MAQIKALFQDTWETIPGNCDTLIYLGGNEQSTHKYVSESMGKGTIDKRSSGETKGKQGSASRNYDVLGRELMTPDETRKLSNKQCLIFIRGFDPIVDQKFSPFGHPRFNQTAVGKGMIYVHEPGLSRLIPDRFNLLNASSLAYYEKRKSKGEAVYIDTLTYKEFRLLGELEMKKRFQAIDEREQKAKLNEKQGKELEYAEEGNSSETGGGHKASIGSRLPELQGEDTITNRMITWKFSKEQKDELRQALKAKMPREDILQFFYPDIPAEEMARVREEFVAQKEKIGGK